MSDQWWMNRCTHRMSEEKPLVVRETEGAAVLYFLQRDVVHILVDRTGLGSICKQITGSQFHDLDNPDLTKLIQAQVRELRQSLG